MNFNVSNWFKFIVVLVLSAVLIVFPTQVFSQADEIIVDVNQILTDVSNNPLGIGLHFAGDNPEVAEPLKQLGVRTLRYATNEYYLFDIKEPDRPKVSIQDNNNSIVKGFAEPDGTWWGELKNFDDFMTVCQSVNAEPFIVVAIDAIVYTGDAPHATPKEVLQGAVDWVKYANLVKGYNVKYWEIGNESDLSPEPTVWGAQEYAETVIQFSRAMKAVDPSIKIGANGMPNEGDTWWADIMPKIKNDVDFLVTHQYSWLKDYQEWKNDPWEYDGHIKKATEAINTYKPSLRLNVTENSSFNTSLNVNHTNNAWKMLHNFEVLGQALRFKKVDFIHFWTSRWLEEDAYQHDFSAFDAEYKLMPMGYPLLVWNKFLKSKMVYSTKKLGFIRSWASYDPESKSLSIFLLNKDDNPQRANVALKDYDASFDNTRWTLKGLSPESSDVSFQQSKSIPIERSKFKVSLEPLSVTVITFPGS